MTRKNRRAFHDFPFHCTTVLFPVSCFLFSLFSLFSLLLGFPLSNVTVISDRGKTICFEAMAPKAESVVILADVGRKLSDDAAREVLDIAQSILKNKLFYGWKTDSVSGVLFKPYIASDSCDPARSPAWGVAPSLSAGVDPYAGQRRGLD